MQYRTGTVDVGQDSDLRIVTGNGTAFLSLSLPLYFKIDSDGAPVYEVATIDSDTQITLISDYAGTPASSLNYQLVQDFSVNYQIPLPSQGDADAGDWIRRSIVEIDQWLFGPKWGVRTKTLTENDTLTTSSAKLQFLNASGANRSVILPAEQDSCGLFFMVIETAGNYSLLVKNDGLTLILTIPPGKAGLVACNGAMWAGLLGS